MDTRLAQVREFWNRRSCGTQATTAQKFTKRYFEDIEQNRYTLEPEIFACAQFTRHYGQKVLEIGVGAGTDFLQWVRTGAEAHGVDLTPEAIENTRHRVELYGFEAKDLRVADCEALPYENDMFDLVYSWGVIHHSPDMARALREIVRVTRPAGVCKLMIYNRRSLFAFYIWIKKALFAGRPWKSIAWCLDHHWESPGTKAFTVPEIRQMLKGFPVEDVRIEPGLTYYDKLLGFNKGLQLLARVLALLMGGDRAGYYMVVVFNKSVTSAAQ